MPQNALTLLEILRDLLLGAAAGLAGGFVRWNNPERRRFGWCLAWEVPSAALVGSAGYALGGFTAWSLAAEGGVDLTLEEEDAAVWDWNPAVDERATGSNPAVVLPNPGVIAAPTSITVETPQTTAFAVLAVSWSTVGSSHLAGYQVEFLPASVAAWQGYGGSLGATAAAIPTAEPTGFRVRAVARSGAVSGWRQALVPAAVAAPTATGIAGGVRLSGGVPPDAVRLQVFEASTSSLAAATKLAAEPTSLFWDRSGLSAGDTRWYWLRAVSAEGNVSALAGPVSATAL